MRMLLLPVLLLASLFVAAQTPADKSAIPADKIEAAAKPFLGTFDAVSCEPSGDVAGLRFRFEQTKPTENPVATLLDLSDGKDVETVDNKFETLSFSEEKGRNVLWISNGGVLVALFEFKDSGKLIGMAFSERNQSGNPVMFAHNNGDLLTFTKDNANLCTDYAARRKFYGVPEPPKEQ